MGAVGRPDVDVFKRVRILLEFRLDFQHDMVLVQLSKHGRDQTLAEGVVQRVVDHLRGNCIASSAVAIDNESRLQSFSLLIAGHVPKIGQHLQFLHQPGRPRVQFFRIGVLKAVLELGAADAIVHREVLNRLHEERDALNFFNLRLQSPDNLCGICLAFIMGLQVDLHPPAVEGCVRSVNSDERRQALHIRISKDDLRQYLLALGHRGERNALLRFRDA